MKKIAKGWRGDWFANAWTGERLPCLDAKFLGAKGEYFEPYFYDPKRPKCAELTAAVEQGRVLVATYKIHEGKPRRDGYLSGIFTVENVRHDQTGLRCRLVARQQP